MYTTIVTICEFVVIFMSLTRNCTVYVNKIYVLFLLGATIQVSNLVYYNCHPLEDDKKKTTSEATSSLTPSARQRTHGKTTGQPQSE